MGYRANESSATTLGVLVHPGLGSFSHTYPRTGRILRSLPTHRFHNPEQIVHPAGTTHHGALYELGHPKHQFEVPNQLTPKMLRRLSDVFYRTRKQPGTIHIFGIIDTISPLGSYALFESLLRHFMARNRSVAIHAGAWAPTPREFRHNYHNLKSLAEREHVSFASLFPAEVLHSKKLTKQYIDGLQRYETDKPQFPMHRPHILSTTDVSADDIFLILYPPSRETDTLHDSLDDLFPTHYRANLPYDFHADSAIQKTLEASKHVLAVANRPSYIDAYFGTELTHPYFESMIVDSPIELLEMLISPHFGYVSDPYRTTILVDAMKSEMFDWLMASYIRKQMTKPFLFHMISGNQLLGSRVFSNRIESTQPWLTHQDVHWYGA